MEVKSSTYDKKKIIKALFERKITKQEARYLLTTTIFDRHINQSDPKLEEMQDLCDRADVWLLVFYSQKDIE
jgi:hypothetical protein